MSELERHPEVPASTRDEALCPAPTGEESREAPRNSNGDLTFLRQHEWVPEVPVATREEFQGSCRNSRNPDSPPFCCRVSREIPPSLLSLERVLDTLYATQEVSRHTRLHSRGTLSFPPQLKKSPGFPSSSRDEGPIPCFVCKGIPTFPSHLRRRPVSPLNSR